MFKNLKDNLITSLSLQLARHVSYNFSKDKIQKEKKNTILYIFMDIYTEKEIQKKKKEKFTMKKNTEIFHKIK